MQFRRPFYTTAASRPWLALPTARKPTGLNPVFETWNILTQIGIAERVSNYNGSALPRNSPGIIAYMAAEVAC
jgi:hypothetical protein